MDPLNVWQILKELFLEVANKHVCERKQNRPFPKVRRDKNLLGKLGNIVAETLCFLPMFPCLPTSGNIVGETKFASQEAKMFPNKFRNISVEETMFLVCPHVFKLSQHEKHCFTTRRVKSTIVLT